MDWFRRYPITNSERREALKFQPFSERMGLPVWKVIYVASNWKEAEEMKDRLAKEGLMVMLRTGSRDKQTARNVELLVPRLEAREAHSIIMQYIGTARV